MKSIIVRSGITSVSLERVLKTIIHVRITGFIHLCWDKCILPLLLASSAHYTNIKCPGLMRFQNTHIHFGPFLGSAMSCSSSLQVSLLVWLPVETPAESDLPQGPLSYSQHEQFEKKAHQRSLQTRGNLLWGDWVDVMMVLPTGRSSCPSSYPFISLPALASITHGTDPVHLTDPPWKELYFPCLVLLSSTDLRSVKQTSRLGGDPRASVGEHMTWEGQKEVQEPGDGEAPGQLEPACCTALYNNELSDKITNSEKIAPWAHTPFSIWWESV